MAVRKRVAEPESEQTEAVFEDIIKRSDSVVPFTIGSISRDIVSLESRITEYQADIVKLQARKTAAEKL